MSISVYNKFLLFVAGLGGLLYGIDVGVIAGALPYLQATTEYTAQQYSIVVAAVLLGSVLSSLFAGALSDLFGRKWVMILAGVCFVLSVPVICLPSGFAFLVAGRILQGVAAGFIGVVVPLYLAECLTADKRGFGTGMFQFMLTIGLVFAALVGLYFANYVDGVKALGDPSETWKAMDFAWKAIFWACAVPGVIFSVGALFVSESPAWLFKSGKKDAAFNALLRSRTAADAEAELADMGRQNDVPAETSEIDSKPKDSLFKKKYIVPFVIAVVILACNQATGINSVLAYIVDILKQAGLEGSVANQGDLVVKVLNMVMTIVAMILVDRKGRKFLLTVGTSGIIVGLLGVAGLFLNSELKMEKVAVEPKAQVVKEADLDKVGMRQFKEVETVVVDDQGVETKKVEKVLVTKDVNYDYFYTITPAEIAKLTGKSDFGPAQVKLVYRQNGDVGIKTVVVRGTETDEELTVKVPQLLIKDDAGKETPAAFEIESLSVGPLPGAVNGWLVVFFFAIFIASFAVGPGVCVWLALSELMPTRIRANGMSIALLINQGVSTVIAGTFLPVVGNWGYSTIFFFCAACTVIYWITAVFFLPETKGKRLEQIEAYFEGNKDALKDLSLIHI